MAGKGLKPISPKVFPLPMGEGGPQSGSGEGLMSAV
jgi:hypothetical protein